jgi:hypothetical protein
MKASEGLSLFTKKLSHQFLLCLMATIKISVDLAHHIFSKSRKMSSINWSFILSALRFKTEYVMP